METPHITIPEIPNIPNNLIVGNIKFIIDTGLKTYHATGDQLKTLFQTSIAGLATETYVDDADIIIYNSGKTYSDEVSNTALQTAKNYSDDQDAVYLNTSKSYTDTQIAALIGGAPSILNTLFEIDNAINNNASIAADLTALIALKANDNSVVHLAGSETISGAKTFSGQLKYTYGTPGLNKVLISDIDGNISWGTGGANPTSLFVPYNNGGTLEDSVIKQDANGYLLISPSPISYTPTALLHLLGKSNASSTVFRISNGEYKNGLFWVIDNHTTSQSTVGTIVVGGDVFYSYNGYGFDSRGLTFSDTINSNTYVTILSDVGNIGDGEGSIRIKKASNFDIYQQNRLDARFDYLGNFGIGTSTNSITARTHIQGSTADSTAYALKVDDVSSGNLLSVRNDSYIKMGADGLIMKYHPSTTAYYLIHHGSLTPDVYNYAIAISSTDTVISAPTKVRISSAGASDTVIVSNDKVGIGFDPTGGSNYKLLVQANGQTYGFGVRKSDNTTYLFTVTDSGRINMGSLPTSASGLSTGDLWNDAGTIKIV